jgi:uncharacterized protein (TIGR03437 family)
VTSSSPAVAGETVAVFCTGLGAVTPTVTAGSAAPSNPLATVPAGLVFIDIIDSSGNYVALPASSVKFAGLTPTLGGLYQINFVIPSGLASGSATLEIDTGYMDASGNPQFDAASYMATIPIK